MSGALNLTQHAASADQIAAGVIDLDPETRAAVSALLTFDVCPDAADIKARAHDLAAIAAWGDARENESGAVLYDRVMIGGAPWLMAPLAAALKAEGLEPVFAFSRREAAEQAQPDGTVRKTAVFRHAGWVDA